MPTYYKMHNTHYIAKKGLAAMHAIYSPCIDCRDAPILHNTKYCKVLLGKMSR